MNVGTIFPPIISPKGGGRDAAALFILNFISLNPPQLP